VEIPISERPLNFVNPLNAVIFFIVIKDGIGCGTVDPVSDFFHSKALGIGKWSLHWPMPVVWAKPANSY